MKITRIFKILLFTSFSVTRSAMHRNYLFYMHNKQEESLFIFRKGNDSVPSQLLAKFFCQFLNLRSTLLI